MWEFKPNVWSCVGRYKWNFPRMTALMTQKLKKKNGFFFSLLPFTLTTHVEHCGQFRLSFLTSDWKPNLWIFYIREIGFQQVIQVLHLHRFLFHTFYTCTVSLWFSKMNTPASMFLHSFVARIYTEVKNDVIPSSHFWSNSNIALH